MRFALVDRAKAEFPGPSSVPLLGVSQSGYFAWRSRPTCRRQRDDMVLLAHVRSAFSRLMRGPPATFPIPMM
jgi:putative transposase